jgi:hypothetical protein
VCPWPQPKVAFAYSFESRLASNPNGPSNTVRQYITTPYMTQQHNAFEPLLTDNIDTVIAKRARHHAVLAWEAISCVTRAVSRGYRHVVI